MTIVPNGTGAGSSTGRIAIEEEFGWRSAAPALPPHANAAAAAGQSAASARKARDAA